MADDTVNILLVDDQPAKLLTYEAILGDLGHRLIKANSGTEALERLLEEEVAVVLMDVCMPNLDGFELAELIHQHPRCQRTAIIFISAVHLTNLDQVRGYQIGAVDYVSVPVVPEILRARVEVFADLHRKTRQLEDLNRELERRVEERTRQLEFDLAERLRLESALKDVDRRKDEFLAMLSHELRNPLAPIRNAIDILGRLPTEEPQTAWCRDVISRQIGHLTRLVDDLLDVSRITRGKIRVERELVDLGEVVDRAIETNQPIFDARSQTLRVTMPPSPVAVEGDLTRLGQIVGNLLNNAAKYSADGGEIRLRVELEPLATSAQVAIHVEDDGVGIPSEKLPHLFELFSQMDHSIDRAEGGLGIGLALVKRLAVLHKGTVEASSDGIGRGSRFVVRLPLASGTTVPTPAPPATLDEVPPGRRRVLVADDNRDACDALVACLRLAGAEVASAYDGVEAVAAADRFRPDLVLLDIGMPRMDGYEAARRIRAEPWGRDMLLVAQTGWGQDDDRRRAEEAGFDGHLTKPVEHVELMRLLARAATHAQRIGDRA